MTVYIIVTTSLFVDSESRKRQYIESITRLKNSTSHKIIIVENNGPRKTFLDDLGCDVFYTENNKLCTGQNKGYTELRDILDCAEAFGINNSDFIVKITGRYRLHEDSEFMRIVNDENMPYECVIRYGSYNNPVNYKMEDCITGLIGMSYEHVKKIQFPKLHECVEWKWARATYGINESKIYKVNTLGIDICPESRPYFAV